MFSFVFIDEKEIKESIIKVNAQDSRIRPAMCFAGFHNKYVNKYPMFMVFTFRPPHEKKLLQLIHFLNSYEHINIKTYFNFGILNYYALESKIKKAKGYIGISIDITEVSEMHRFILILLLGIMLRFFSQGESVFFPDSYENILDLVIQINNTLVVQMCTSHTFYNKMLSEEIIEFLLNKNKMEKAIYKLYGDKKLNYYKEAYGSTFYRQSDLIDKLLSVNIGE